MAEPEFECMSIWFKSCSKLSQWIVLPMSAQTGDFISSEKSTVKESNLGSATFPSKSLMPLRKIYDPSLPSLSLNGIWVIRCSDRQHQSVSGLNVESKVYESCCGAG